MGAERDRMLSHYRLIGKIGAGGMGVVWKAKDTLLERTVAIKMLAADFALDDERRRMFLDEARLAASVSHAHIVQVYELGRDGDLDFIVMEYVEGQALSTLLHGRPLPPEKVADWGLQVAEGLARAHRKNLIHRDLKPANILVTPDNEVKIVDFGLAVLFEPRDLSVGPLASTLTDILPEETRTRIAGTLPYMSPEQVRGERLDARSDIFSFGTVLYEMTTGQRPFTGSTHAEVVQGILKGQPTPVHRLVEKVPLDLHRTVEKALARRPADRYQDMDDVAVDLRRLRRDLESGSTPPYEVPRPLAAAPRRRRRLVVATGAVASIVLALTVWLLGRSFLRDRPPDPGKKAWILVAEFEGPAEDSLLVAATRDLVIAALEESEIVATVPRDQVRLALQMAGKPDSTRVDAEVARELAYRSAVRTVLEGRVGRLGSGYSLVLRLVDADSARVVVAVSGTASDEEDMIPTVGGIAQKLRSELGERRGAIQATRELISVTTPSLEAYKAYTRARVLLFGNENRAAITVYRSALALDPDFAPAWSGLGWCFGNLAEPDSALVAFRQALARPDRLTLRGKLFVAAQVAYLSGDIAGALAGGKQLVQLYPESWSAHSNLSVYLSDAGRPHEALESCRTAQRVSPFGPSQQVLGNQFWRLLDLGRVDESRTLVPRLKANLGPGAPMWIAAAAGRWSAAESLATRLWSNPTADSALRANAGSILAASQASRGQVRAADQTLVKVQSEAEAASEMLLANRARWTRLMLALFSHGVAADPGNAGVWDSTTAGLVTQGQWAAAAGDTALARQILATIRTRSAPDLARQGFTPLLLQAWIAARAGRWQQVQQDLSPAALRGEAPGYVLLQSAPLVRWLVAEAYERLDRPDSAVVYFERAIAPPPVGGRSSSIPYARMASSFGRMRLALLYARMGHLQEAKRHWGIFQETCTNPDPELLTMIEAAQQVLAIAEAKH